MMGSCSRIAIAMVFDELPKRATGSSKRRLKFLYACRKTIVFPVTALFG
jgi:hypothetical protein